MSKFQAPNPPYVEAYNVGDKQKPTAIKLTMGFTTSDKGAALGVANRLHLSSAPPESYHYMVDEAEIYQGVWDRFAAYHTPYRAIDVLVCADPVENVKIWSTSGYRDVLHRTSELVAELCLAYKIPARYIDGEDFARWQNRKTRRRGGIILGTIGEWPKDQFIIDVEAQTVIKSF